MGLYPIGLELAGKACLVVGGGEVAERKVGGLLRAGAQVTVVAPEITPALRLLAGQGTIRWIPREYRTGDLDGFTLVVAATDVQPVNRQVEAEARQKRVLVNVCDRPELCSFVLPAVVRRGDLTLAVFTGGRSPLLARKIREDLEQQYGPEYAEFLSVLGNIRRRLRAEVAEARDRQEVYRRLVYSDALELLRQGRRDMVEAMAEELVQRVRSNTGQQSRSHRGVHHGQRDRLSHRSRPGQPQAHHCPRPGVSAPGRSGGLRPAGDDGPSSGGPAGG